MAKYAPRMSNGGYKECPACRQPAELDARFCQKCGHQYRTEFATPPPQPTQMFSGPAYQHHDNTWMLIAILLALFVGLFGVHRMYLGHMQTGITMLVIAVVGILTACLFVGYLILIAVEIWALVDCIMIATGNLRPVRQMP